MFRDTLVSLLTSKKAIAAAAGLILTLCARAGIILPEESVTEILGVVIAYLIGQGMADIGKEAIKADNE